MDFSSIFEDINDFQANEPKYCVIKASQEKPIDFRLRHVVWNSKSVTSSIEIAICIDKPNGILVINLCSKSYRFRQMFYATLLNLNICMCKIFFKNKIWIRNIFILTRNLGAFLKNCTYCKCNYFTYQNMYMYVRT